MRAIRGAVGVALLAAAATLPLGSEAAADVVTGAGAGGGPHVRVFDNAGMPTPTSFLAYDPAFGGGVSVAMGNVDGGLDTEIITGAGPGGGPHVRVFKANGTPGLSLIAYAAAFRGGVFVASGNVVSGAGFEGDEIVTGTGEGGGPHVRVLKGDGSPIASFFAYPMAFRGGARVATADVDDDGISEVVTGAGPGGGPHVRAFGVSSGGAVTEKTNFFAYNVAFRGGVYVSGGHFDANQEEIVTGAGPGGGPHVRGFGINGATVTEKASFFAYPAAFRGGVRVTTQNVDADFAIEIVTGAGPGGGPHVRAFNPDGSPAPMGSPLSFFAYAPGFTGGVFVGA